MYFTESEHAAPKHSWNREPSGGVFQCFSARSESGRPAGVTWSIFSRVEPGTEGRA